MRGAEQRDTLGPVMSVRPVPLVRFRDVGRLSAIVEAVRAGRWAPDSRFVKREGGRWVWMGELRTEDGDESFVVKGAPGSRLWFIPPRRAVKQALGAARLRKIGVRTSEPAALLDVRTEPGGRERWLVLTTLRGESLARVLAEGGMRFEEGAALARRAGELVRAMNEARVFNRDHKASNLIVGPGGGIGVVDTVAIRRRGGATARRRMLLAMCKELAGIGALPRRAQLMRCARAASEDARGDWGWVEAAMRRAGDTAPRVDPVEQVGA